MSTSTPREDDSPSVRKRPRLSDELVEEQVTNVARSDSFSDGFFGSDIDFDDEAMQMVDEYDVFQPEVDVTCVANSGDDPFLDGANGNLGGEEEEEEIPSSQGEADAVGLYTVEDIHGDCPSSSQSPLRNTSPSVGAFKRTSSRQLKNLGPPVPTPLFPSKSPLPSKRPVHIAGINDDDPEQESNIDFGAYVNPIPAAVGFASAAAVLTDPDIPTFMPASQVPIDRSELASTSAGLKPAIKSSIKLAGGGGALKPISVEAIKASANKLMGYQQDTNWKPQTRLRTMLPPTRPSAAPTRDIVEPSREPAESIREPIEPVIPSEDEEKELDIDFSALINPTIGFTSASANVTYDDSMPTFMPASRVPIDRSELASAGTSTKPLTRSEIQLAGGAGGLKPLTEEEIKASAEKLMAYQQDTKWRPQTRLRVPRLPSSAKPPSTPQAGDLSTSELDSANLDDSGVGLLEPVGSESVDGTKGKGKQRAMTPPPQFVPNPMSPSRNILRSMENLSDTRPIDGLNSVSQPVVTALRPNIGPTAPQRESENPFSARAQLAATPVDRSTAAFKTPIRSAPASRPSTEFPSESTIQTPLFSQATPSTQTPSFSQAGPSTLYRLGLSQRKPKTKAPAFTTPFKRGMAPGEKGREVLDLKNRGTPSRTGAGITGLPTPIKFSTPGGGGRMGVNGSGTSAIARALEAEKQRQMLERAVFDTRRTPGRKGLCEAGVVPSSGGQAGFAASGLNIPYLTLKSAGSFSFPQGGHVAMLAVLREHGCTLADKEWVQNHWAQVVWKLSGLARIANEETKGKWSWEEALRQMLYRYEREINRAERPAIRQIQEHDASAARAMVLCVSDVQLREKDEVEIELTDGWYRIRTVSDKALARAAKKGKLVVGRKLAVAGARLEGGHDGKEVLQAYHSSVLKIGGNSTSLAPWDARLGFQLRPYIASLRSLTSDGGTVPLLDVEVMKLFPVGFVETDQMGRSGPPCDQSGEDEAQRAWENRRTSEAGKWRIQFEKHLERMRAAVSRLTYMAKGVSLNPDASPPDDTEDFLESLEDAEYDLEVLKARAFAPTSAAWLADAIRTKCDEQYEKREEEMERELTSTCPPRKVRNFRVVVIKDACALRKPTSCTAQLTAWDVLGFGSDSLKVGQRYLLANVQPSQASSWRKGDDTASIYLSTRRDTKWTAVSGS